MRSLIGERNKLCREKLEVRVELSIQLKNETKVFDLTGDNLSKYTISGKYGKTTSFKVDEYKKITFNF